MQRNPFPTWLQSISLRKALTIPLMLQILGTVGVVGYLSFRNGQQTVNDLASQLRQELTARIERELQGYFETPHEINRLNAAAFTRGDLDVVKGKQGGAQMYQQMRIAPTVAFVYCGSAREGEFFGVLRSPDTGVLQLVVGNRSNTFLRDYYRMDVNGDPTYRIRQADKPFDSRLRPWFKEALAVQAATWTDVYIASTTGLPNITASLPVYDRQGRELLGVCASDVVLPEEFRDFLRGLEIGKTGQAFVIDREGALISNSTDEPLMVGTGEAARSLRATDSQDRLVRGTAEYLANRFGGFKQIQQPQRLVFQLNGQRQFLEVVPFRDGFGLDWLIVVVVPEADFIEQIHANTRNTIWLCLAALGIALAIAFWAARWISQPILRVSKATEEIAQGNLEQHLDPSKIAEIQTLAKSFNSMSARLKASFSALKASEATNRAIVTAIPDLLIRTNADGVYLDIVGRDRLMGVHSNEAFRVGASVRDSLPPNLAEMRLHYIQRALETGNLQVYEHRIKVGERLQDEEVRIAVLGEREVLIMVRDITIRKRAEDALRIAEENYRSIYENALEGIFQSDPDGYFLSVNPAMAEIYGYDSPEEMCATITDIGTQIYVNPSDQWQFKQTLATYDQVTDFEYQVYRKDRRIIWIQEQTRAVRDDCGNLLYYEGLIKDITERKRREEELRRQLEQLQVEIDQSRRKKDVDEITQSSYFQEIQEQFAAVNLDEFWS